MGNEQSKGLGDSPPPYSSSQDLSQLSNPPREGAQDFATPSWINSYTSPSSVAPSRSSRINNQLRTEARRPREDVEMGVGHGQAVGDFKKAQEETNEKLAELAEKVSGLVRADPNRDNELACLRNELAKEKGDRERVEREKKGLEALVRAYAERDRQKVDSRVESTARDGSQAREEPAMGVLAIRECSAVPIDTNDFSEWVHVLRKRYEQACETHNIRRVGDRWLKSIIVDRIQDIEFHIFFYDDGTSRVQCIRIANIPGTLSGDILRLRRSIPELSGEDHEIVGDEVRPLVGQEAPPAQMDIHPDAPEDPTDMVESLPIIEKLDDSKHYTRRAKHRSEISNHLRCQGGSCPGTPISPHITRLLGKSPEGQLVFEKLLSGEVFEAFDRLHDYKLWILQLISGVKALHSLGIIHRNLCLDNVYFRYGESNEPELVIGGISGQGGNDDAPEIPSQLVLDSDFNEKTDIYDIGEVITSLVYGDLPITKAVYRELPYPLQGIVDACQHTSPELRPGLNSLQMMVEKIQAVGLEEDDEV